MIELKNVCLKKYTTIKIGGTAEQLFIPESQEELITLLNSMREKKDSFYILGGGSNILINDEKKYSKVICLKSFDQNVDFIGDNRVRVGASVMLPQFINMINGMCLGGIEYLYSVPGTIGGAIAMNAGRGKNYNQNISDYLESVDVWEDGKTKTYLKKDCCFSYRNSKFKNSNIIILGAEFRFDNIGKEESAERKQKRIQLCRKVQDNSHNNFGSVFSEYNYVIMKMIRFFSRESKNSAFFSHKTINWILNNNGTFNDVIKKVEFAERIHHFLGKKAKREFIIWD